MIKKKIEKSHPEKRLNIRVGSKWHIFQCLIFWGFLSRTPFKTIKLQKLGVFWKIQEICNKMGTRICKIVEEMAEIIKPKVGNPKNSVSRNWAILSYPWNLIFFRMRFSNFFLNYMVWKYQNEIAPIFYYGISTKTNEKDLKIPNLQPPDWGQPCWMTLYQVQPS